MSFQRQGAPSLDYQPVSYPGSQLRFRGPSSDLKVPHILCLGGTETFGRFVPEPYPSLLAFRSKLPVTNMGVAGAGLDVPIEDPAIQQAMTTAKAIVLQVCGAQSISNRFYTVHPRRNDRFVRAAGILRTIYRDVDFTEFHFTRHMLDHLKGLSADRFAILRDELQAAWSKRMQRFIQDAPAPVHVLWFARRSPETSEPETGLGEEPLFVTRRMLEEATGGAASVSIVEASIDTADVSAPGAFHPVGEVAAAKVMPGPKAHEAACAALLSHLASED